MNTNYLHTQLYRWYEQNHRILPWRETTDPYKIWVSEIILQQTRVEQGMPYYQRFCTRFPNVESLATAAEDEVMLYWQGLGYYSRARNLHTAAQQVMNIFNGSFPSTYDDIRTLKGIGDYTAGAIAAFAYNLPYPAIDGNVYRVLSRLFDCEEEIDSTNGKKLFREYAYQILDSQNPRLHNQSIMEFGALFCIPQNPECAICPLKEICAAYANNTVSLLPIKKKKAALRDRYLYYTIYLCEQAGKTYTLLHQRNTKDIWQHLYEFVLEEKSVGSNDTTLLNINHILSHQRLHAYFRIQKVKELPTIDDYFAINITELDNFALSRLTLKAIEALNL